MTDGQKQASEAQEIEAIRRLKAQYVRFGDTKQWDQLGDLLAEDVETHFDGIPRFSKDQPTSGGVNGRDNFLKLFGAMLADVKTVHNLYSNEITLTGSDTATGIWSMHDMLWLPTCFFKGWGHYHEDYVKVDGAWKIRRCRVTRLHTEELWY